MAEKSDRRSFLNKSLLGAVGVGTAVGLEEKILLAAIDSGAAQTKRPKPTIAAGGLPCGKIGNVSISRLFIGCNLIGGFAHSRDLIYVSKLFLAYNTEAKIIETLELAQDCGINTMLVSPHIWGPVMKYNKSRTTKLQTLVNFHLFEGDKQKTIADIQRSVDNGATLMYAHGAESDWAIRNDRIDVLGEALDVVRKHGIPVGVGSHSLEVPMACEKNKLRADFYMKTFHSDRYWSATPKANRKDYDWTEAHAEHDMNNDNMWCNNPEETAAFMETVEKPWIAFKVMAAGAISPRIAFSYAYRHGADFICAGMFDFQVEDDVNIAIETLPKAASRKRPWRG